MKRLILAAASALVLATTSQAYTGNQTVPLTCAAVFDTAAREYTRLNRTQDSQASDYLAGAFEQHVIKSAGPKGRVAAVKQLRGTQDTIRVTAQMNGGLKWLQPRIAACVGLADGLGI